MKAAALAGAAYLASKHMGAGKKEKTPIKDYLTGNHKINHKKGIKILPCLVLKINLKSSLLKMVMFIEVKK
jgi:hypothetical protein